MKTVSKKLIGMVAAAVFACSLAALAGCSSSAGSASASASAGESSAAASAEASSAASEAASESAASEESSAASEGASESSAGIANPWSEAASAEEAAKGAGLEAFPLPEGAIADLGKPVAITYRYMDGMAEAVFEFPASAVIVRTAAIDKDESYDISGDYNTYAHEWTENIDNVSVACAGNREGESAKTYWGDEGIAHSLVAEGLGGDEDFGLGKERLTVFVEAMK